MARSEIASVGWFGHANCGDEAFKDALRSLFPEHNITFFNQLYPNLKQINSKDYLLIGGGNIVSKEFLKGLDEVKVPYSYIGVGLVKSSDTQLLTRAEHVLLRDANSMRNVRDVDINPVVIPDITFCLEPDQKRGKELLQGVKNINPTRQTVGVFLNDCVSARFDSSILKFMEAEKVKLELARFLESLPYNILFIPMSYVPPDDRRISLDVIGKMQKGFKYTCITEELDPQACLDLVSALDFGITMRLHASIFCTLAGVPFIDITHHDKSRGYLQSIEHSDYSIDYYELSNKNLGSKFRLMEQRKSFISESLLAIKRSNKVLLRETIQNVHLLP